MTGQYCKYKKSLKFLILSTYFKTVGGWIGSMLTETHGHLYCYAVPSEDLDGAIKMVGDRMVELIL